jgi:hypothetical protein
LPLSGLFCERLLKPIPSLLWTEVFLQAGADLPLSVREYAGLPLLPFCLVYVRALSYDCPVLLGRVYAGLLPELGANLEGLICAGLSPYLWPIPFGRLYAGLAVRTCPLMFGLV